MAATKTEPYRATPEPKGTIDSVTAVYPNPVSGRRRGEEFLFTVTTGKLVTNYGYGDRVVAEGARERFIESHRKQLAKGVK
jgi:hypothetical protein